MAVDRFGQLVRKGARVLARFRHGSSWFPGRVTAVRLARPCSGAELGSEAVVGPVFSIAFDDGDVEPAAEAADVVLEDCKAPSPSHDCIGDAGHTFREEGKADSTRGSEWEGGASGEEAPSGTPTASVRMDEAVVIGAPPMEAVLGPPTPGTPTGRGWKQRTGDGAASVHFSSSPHGPPQLRSATDRVTSARDDRSSVEMAPHTPPPMTAEEGEHRFRTARREARASSGALAECCVDARGLSLYVGDIVFARYHGIGGSYFRGSITDLRLDTSEGWLVDVSYDDGDFDCALEPCHVVLQGLSLPREGDSETDDSTSDENTSEGKARHCLGMDSSAPPALAGDGFDDAGGSDSSHHDGCTPSALRSSSREADGSDKDKLHRSRRLSDGFYSQSKRGRSTCSNEDDEGDSHAHESLSAPQSVTPRNCSLAASAHDSGIPLQQNSARQKQPTHYAHGHAQESLSVMSVSTSMSRDDRAWMPSRGASSPLTARAEPDAQARVFHDLPSSPHDATPVSLSPAYFAPPHDARLSGAARVDSVHPSRHPTLAARSSDATSSRSSARRHGPPAHRGRRYSANNQQQGCHHVLPLPASGVYNVPMQSYALSRHTRSYVPVRPLSAPPRASPSVPPTHSIGRVSDPTLSVHGRCRKRAVEVAAPGRLAQRLANVRAHAALMAPALAMSDSTGSIRAVQCASLKRSQKQHQRGPTSAAHRKCSMRVAALVSRIRAMAVERCDEHFQARDPIVVVSTGTMRDGLDAAGFAFGSNALAALRSAFRLREVKQQPARAKSLPTSAQPEVGAAIAVLPLAEFLVGDAARSNAVLLHADALAGYRSGRMR